MINDLQKMVNNLKKETNTAILAHSYQAQEIVEIADYIGDSFQLSLKAKEINNDRIILCGVHFMAETVKILAPEKHIYLANQDAGCPMAEQFSKEDIQKIKDENPELSVVCYINTTAKLKEVCDVCVTSSTAVKIVEKMDAKKILFIPDQNLGNYVKQQVKGKEIILLNGCCPVHAKATLNDLNLIKNKHPLAKILVHPECVKEILDNADYIGSTSGIMDFVRKSNENEFIIGTEISIAMHLQYEFPDKKIYALSKKITCPNMRLTSLGDVYQVLKDIKENQAEEILLSDEEINHSRKCIDQMILLGK